ncbi:MAG: c-type cytochrome [Gemmatimonadota bacterium]
MNRAGYRRGVRGVGLVAAALFLRAVPGLAQAPAPGPQDPSTGDAARLYAGACAPCHGRLGDGNGRGSRLLGAPKPRDFTSGTFKFRRTPTGSLPADEDMYRTISRGVPGTWMPAWEDLLSPAQRWALVRYIKGFSEFFAEEEPDPAVEIPPEPGPSPELLREGRFVYVMLKCWDCHGSLGRGDGPSAAELTDDWGERIKPYDFTRGGYKNGSAPSDLYRTLVTGLNGTPMPAFERDIVAFPGGAKVDVGPVREAVDAESLPELEAYLAGQPTAAELEAMPEAALEELVQRRLWALVYYVRSLNRPKGAFYWLFGENPEMAGEGGER